MPSLEQIIRPFEKPSPFGQLRIVATSIKAPTQIAHIAWGTVGTLPTAIESGVDGPAIGPNFNVKKDDDQVTEKSRVIEKVKITQEDNPDNFVVVERIKSITFGQTPDTGTPPTYLTKQDGGTSQQTEGVRPPIRLPDDQGGGDIPVVKSGAFLFVDRRNLPADHGYFQIGDRVYTLVNPPPTANESIVP